MIHPSEILRANSDGQSQFSAPVNRHRQNLDCGLSAAPWLTKKLSLKRFATPAVFVTVFACLGLLQGALLSYFRGTSHIWTQHYYFSETAMTWLIHLNEIIVGVFAFIITHWGNKIHRPVWFGGMAMLQAIACITLVVPEVFEPHVEELPSSSNVTNLCTRTTSLTTMVEFRESNWVALGALIIFQLFFAFTSIVFYTLGITYLDDNIEKENAPIYLIIPLATKIAGKQLGMYLSWIPTLFDSPNVFVTGMWLALSVLIFIFGFLIVLFPHSLPIMLIEKEVVTLLNLANNNREANQENVDAQAEPPKKSRFLASFLRLVKNPVLVVNTLAMVFMLTALINFEIYQNIFYQLRFFVNVGRDLSGYHDPLIAQIIMNIIKYPFIAISLIATGLIVAKTQPAAKSLAIFNVAIYIIAALLYVSFVFSRCNDRINREFDGKLTIPLCSSHCICKDIQFQPVCTTQGNVTYFSPCHAGCKTVETIRGIEIFGNCTCGANVIERTETTAVAGSCQKNNCDLYWAFAQVSSVMASSILASTIVTNLMINLRCVASEDKHLALAFETTLLGILPYIPGKLVYSAVADSTCLARGEDSCMFHSESFGLFFSIITVVLMAISAILATVVIMFIGNLNLYGSTSAKDYDVTMEDMEEIRRPSTTNTPARQNENTNQNETVSRDEDRRLMTNRDDNHIDDSEFTETETEQNSNQHPNRGITSTNADVHNESTSNKNKKSTPDILESDF